MKDSQIEKKKTKQEKRLYKKQFKYCRKLLLKAAKDYRPWDESFLLEFMSIIFTHWKQYYELGYNVIAMEDNEWREDCKGEPSRYEIATELLNRLCKMRDITIISKTREQMDTEAQEFADYFAKYIHWMWD